MTGLITKFRLRHHSLCLRHRLQKRQRAAALQNLAELDAASYRAKRPGVRPSAALLPSSAPALSTGP